MMPLESPLPRPEPGERVRLSQDPHQTDRILRCHGGSSELNLWLVHTERHGWAIVRRSAIGWFVDIELTEPVRRAEGRAGGLLAIA